MKPFWSVAALKAAGFEGFTSVRALRRRRFFGIPDKPGIYITLCRGERAPRLLQVSPAYWFKGREVHSGHIGSVFSAISSRGDEGLDDLRLFDTVVFEIVETWTNTIGDAELATA